MRRHSLRKIWLPTLWLTLWFGAAFFISHNAEFELSRTLQSPSWPHILGYDAFGRNLLTTVLSASLRSMFFALIAVSASCAIGLVFGAGMALSSGRVRFISLRLLELTLALPSLLLALTWAAFHGPGWFTLIVSLAIGTLPSLTRFIFVRSRELLLEDFVTASQSLGANSLTIVKKHLSPALIAICGVKVPNLFAHALLAEATLSFLGVGAPIGQDTWGSLLAQGKDYLIEAPHLALGIGLPLVLTVLSLQMISESLTEES